MAGRKSAILLTREGRRYVAERLGKNWLECERGFLNNDDGTGLSDEELLKVVMDAYLREQTPQPSQASS